MSRFALCLLYAGVAFPGIASAAYDPVGSGSTTITLAKPFLSLLERHHVKLQVGDGARRVGAKIVLPAFGGNIDPRLGAGAVENEGILTFIAGHHKVPFRAVVFKSQRAPLFAKVGGGQLKIATGARLRSVRSGFGAKFSARGLHLTGKVAQRLNKKLRLGKSIPTGEPIGSVRVAVEPATVHLLPTGRLSLTVDPSFHEKLDNLFVSLNPIAPAELSAGPILTFPIGLDSTLAPDGGAGLVKLEGATELLQLGSAQYLWRELWVEPANSALSSETDLEPSPPQPGKIPQGPLFILPPEGMSSAKSESRAIHLAGRPVTLSAATAAALNAAFAEGREVFAAGERVGTSDLAATAE